MRFLIVNTAYPEFLRWLYAQHRGLEKQGYEEQMRVVVESLFGVADFYSTNLRKLGHEAWDIHANNEWMQKAWAMEHGIGVEERTTVQQQRQGMLRRALQLAGRTPLRYLKPLLRPVLHSVDSQPTWLYDILAAQIKHYKPDVLLNQAMVAVSGDFLHQMKPHVRLLVGQIASPIPRGPDFSCYDLVVSSLPNIVDHFRHLGVPSELHKLGFGPRVLEKLKDSSGSIIPVSFVGNLFQAHGARVRWLEYLCQRLDVRIWGIGIDGLPSDSPIRQCHMGTAWGIEMYQILRRSKITLNHHIDMAGDYANNLRLYEATGVGTLLITDWKVNLHEMFEPGKEVVAYRTPQECAELIQYYLEHDEERKGIARAGQQRTLREHGYYQRMQELVEIVGKYL
jgi:hypothetical protein